MKMTVKEKEILGDVRKLKSIEENYLKIFYEYNIPSEKEGKLQYLKNIVNVCAEAHRLRYKICYESQDINNLQLSDVEAKKVLRDIRDDKDKFYSVRCYENILSECNTREGEDKYPIDMSEQLLGDENCLMDFHSCFDLTGFYIRSIKVGPIISSSHISKSVSDYFLEIRKTYAFEQYRSCIALCRSLLEMSLYDKLKKKKLLTSNNSTVIHMRDYMDESLIRLIDIARRNRVLTTILRDKSHDIRKIANKILHAKEENPALSERDALKVIHDTMEVIEYLHRF